MSTENVTYITIAYKRDLEQAKQEGFTHVLEYYNDGELYGGPTNVEYWILTNKPITITGPELKAFLEKTIEHSHDKQLRNTPLEIGNMLLQYKSVSQ